MRLDTDSFLAFFLIFTRCSALLLSSPIFGAQNTPLQVRIFTTVSFAAALSGLIRPHMGPMPHDLLELLVRMAQEVSVGLIIGFLMTLALQVTQIAGAFMDIQVGLGSSQVINPINGVSVTILSQYKFLLGVVIFLSLDAHHLIIEAFVRSYTATPNLSFESWLEIQRNLMAFLKDMFLVAIQITGPVLGVSLVIDAALGLVNRAVPQIQAMQIGLPIKIGVGLIAVGIGLPSLVGGVSFMTSHALRVVGPIFR